MKIQDSVYTRPVQGSLDEVGARLEQAIQDRGYGVLGSIDLRDKMTSKGLDFPRACRVYEVCNPTRAKRVLDEDMSISTALPCRISLFEEEGQLQVATLRPSVILASFARPELDDEARQVEEDLIAILDAVASEA